jgi:hypothetical protein
MARTSVGFLGCGTFAAGIPLPLPLDGKESRATVPRGLNSSHWFYVSVGEMCAEPVSGTGTWWMDRMRALLAACNATPHFGQLAVQLDGGAEREILTAAWKKDDFHCGTQT